MKKEDNAMVGIENTHTDTNAATAAKGPPSIQPIEPQLHIHLIDKLAFFNGLVSGIALYPQLFTLLVYGGKESVSVVTYSLIFSNSVVWVFYAMHRSLLSLFIASALNALAAALILFFTFI